MGRAKGRNDLYVQLPFGVTLDVGSIAPSSRFSRSIYSSTTGSGAPQAGQSWYRGSSTQNYEEDYYPQTYSGSHQPPYSAGSYQTFYTSPDSRPIHPERRGRRQHARYDSRYVPSAERSFPASPPPYSSSYSQRDTHQSTDPYREQDPPQSCIRIGNMEYSFTLDGIKAASRALADQEAVCRQFFDDRGLELYPTPQYVVQAMQVATFATDRQPYEVIERCGKVLQAWSRRLDQARIALDQDVRRGHV